MSKNIGIAYSMKRKAAKMAKGGPVSAKTEKRPMPEAVANDAQDVAQNSSKKPLVQSGWTDHPTVKQARKGLNTTPIKHPKMAHSDVLQARLVTNEDHLQESARVNNGPQHQPPHADNEHGADRKGPTTSSLKMKKMAKGGMINEEVSMHDAEEDNVMHPEGLETDNDQMPPSEDEIMANHFAEGGMAHEMDDQPEDEAALEHHASIVAAIMAKRAAREAFAEGGEVDIDHNAEETPADSSPYDDDNYDAVMKENYDSDMDDVSQPMDSNEHGDERSSRSENKHDHSIVHQVMSRKKKRSPITR